MKCINAHCQKEIGELLFCPYCGTKQVKPKIFCAYCGAEMDDDAVFCDNCGQKSFFVQQKELEDKKKKALEEAEKKAKEEAERKAREEAERKAKEEADRKAKNGHEWIDLGLSVKWATCNVGASSPNDYGNYYAWGETSARGEYSMSTVKYSTGDGNFSKYVPSGKEGYWSGAGSPDNRTSLDLADDGPQRIQSGRSFAPSVFGPGPHRVERTDTK